MATWSVQRYVTVEDERSRPVRYLLGALRSTDVRTAIDLGCLRPYLDAPR